MLNKAEKNNIEIHSGRLKKRPEFLYVAKEGKKWVSDSIVIQAIENDTDQIHFGYTATKKIGNAVIRNRAKRRLRAATDEILKTETLKPSKIVLIARDISPTCEWNKLLSDLKWCLKRLGVLTKID